MDLPALVDFNLVATHGGFGRASRRCGRPKATLSRKVSELEAALGVRLIDRGSHTLRLTDEGRALHELTQGPLGEIAEAGQAITAGQSVPSGRLRISAPIVLAHVLLAKIAADFVAAYPRVELEIVAEDGRVDPVEDNYDLVIRVDPSDDERLVGRRIMEGKRLLVAPPGMHVALRPEHADFVEAVPAVGHVATPKDILWRIETDNAVLVLNPHFGLRFSSFLLIRQAVLAGAGVALMPKLLVHEDIAAGRLVPWGAEHGAKVEIWALQNSRRLSSLKVRAFLEVLTAIPS
ncbi:MAG: LysR family transcriptional regulator [Janthinobacterium lividum]